MVRTTSTSFISGTGLKKCIPMNRSGRLVAVISSVIEMDEVFEAKIASFFTIAVERGIHFFLRGDIFDDGFNHDVAIREVFSARRAFQLHQRLVFFFAAP